MAVRQEKKGQCMEPILLVLLSWALIAASIGRTGASCSWEIH